MVLLWLSGPRTGQELPLPTGHPLVFGRSRQADVQLDDDLVSRQHTRIAWENGHYWVEDLGSKNGTFINGIKITSRTQLQAGDYLRIGEATFHAIHPCVVDDKIRSWWEQTQRTLVTQQFPDPQQAGSAPMISGSLAEVSLLDLLQLLSNSMKTGCVTVRAGKNKGDIFMRQGQIYYAMINQKPPLKPEKVLLRILRWPEGVFTFTPGIEHLNVSEITEPTGSLLLEGVRQADELTAYQAVLPPLDAPLQLNLPLPKPLRECAPEELDMLQYVLEQGILEKVLDVFPGSDLDAAPVLVALLEQKMILAGMGPVSSEMLPGETPKA